MPCFCEQRALELGGRPQPGRGVAMATETPKFKLVEKAGPVEVREYSAYVVAETEVAGEQGEVGNEAFSRLAGYIFGNNGGEKKLAMTAPVIRATPMLPRQGREK